MAARGPPLQSGGDSGACARGGDTSVRASERSRPPQRREGGGWREVLRPTGTDDVQCRAARRHDGAGAAGREGAVTVGYVAAPVPLLAVPLLASAAGEAVGDRTFCFLLGWSLAEKEEEQRRQAEVG